MLYPEMPSIHPSFAIPSPNGGNHTPAFADAARTPEAHEACITITKGLAMTGFRLLDDEAFFKRVSPNAWYPLWSIDEMDLARSKKHSLTARYECTGFPLAVHQSRPMRVR
jgi:hypothetical protein